MAHDNSDSVHISLQTDNPQQTELQPATTSQSSSCIALPAETIYHILRFLSPQDLIRLQAVRSTLQRRLCITISFDIVTSPGVQTIP